MKYSEIVEACESNFASIAQGGFDRKMDFYEVLEYERVFLKGFVYGALCHKSITEEQHNKLRTYIGDKVVKREYDI